MAKDKGSKTNIMARAHEKGAGSICRYCGQKVEVVMRLPGRRMARLCCERQAARAA
jgi:hypothetical protein